MSLDLPPEAERRARVGFRFLMWSHDHMPYLNARDRAVAYEAFAAEFAGLPDHEQPYEEWGETMAWLCRRIAARLRDEAPVQSNKVTVV